MKDSEKKISKKNTTSNVNNKKKNNNNLKTKKGNISKNSKDTSINIGEKKTTKAVKKEEKGKRKWYAIKGFTIIEMIAAVVIVAMLTGIGIVAYNSVFSNASESYYHTLESSLLLSGSDYFQDHREELPANTYSTVSIKDLMDESYTDEIKDKSGNLCLNGEVIAYKDENNRYQYEVCLKCGDYESEGKYCSGYDETAKRIKVPTSILCKSRPTYTGHEVALTIIDGADGFTLSGNHQVGANETGYLITATLKDDYVWSDNTIEPKSFYCKLYKKTPEITLNPQEGYVVKTATINFTEKVETPGTFTNISEDSSIATVNNVTKVNDSESIVEVKGITTNKSTNIAVSFVPDDTNNYNEVKGKDVSKFKVNVINGVDKPTAAKCKDLTYNGEEQTLTTDALIGYTFRNNKAIDADTYTVVARLEKGFVWKDDNTSNDISFECKIKQKELNVSWTNGTYTYNGMEQANTPSVVTGIGSEVVVFNWNKGTDAGSYTSTASCKEVQNGQKKCDNYKLKNTTNSFSISKKSLAITWSGDSFTYNGKEQAKTPNTVTGVGTEIIVFDWNKKIDAGNNYTTTATCASVTTGREKCSNYTFTNASATYSIAKKTLKITWTGETFTYNGQQQSRTPSAVTGVGEEEVVFNWNKGIDAGDYTSTATCASVTNGRKKCDNYDFTDTTNSFTISKKSLKITWTGGPFTYNGKQQARTPSVTTGVGGEKVVFNWNKEINAGDYTSTATCASVTSGRKKCSNYTFTDITNSFSIDKKSLTITWGPNEFIYNGNPQGPTVAVTTGVTGESMDISRTTETDVGNYISTASCTKVTGGQALCTNYELSNPAKTYKINAYTVTVPTLSTFCNTLTYNGKSQTLVKNATTGFEWTESTTRTNAGSQNVTAKLLSTKNYVWSDNTTGNKTITCSIAAKKVSVSWGATSFTYNGSDQGPSASVSTGISGEKMNVIRTMETDVGNYTSTASCTSVTGGQALCSNYEITNPTKDYKITAYRVTVPTVSAYCNNLTYNGSSQTLVKNASEGFSWVSGTTRTNAGSQNVTARLTSFNYAWSDGTTGDKTISCSISAKSISVSWSNTSFDYDGMEHKPTATVSTGVSGETMSLNTTGATNAGSHSSTATCNLVTGGQELCSNYSLTNKTATFTINQVYISVPTTAKCKSLTYNGSSQTLVYAAGEGYSWTSGTTRTSAGSQAVTASLSSNNYKWSDGATGNKTINCSIEQKTLTPSVSAYDKDYNGNTNATCYGASVSGVVSGDSIRASVDSTGTFSSANAGTWTVTCSGISISGTGSSNYKLSSTTATTSAKINKVKAVISCYSGKMNPYTGYSQVIATCSGGTSNNNTATSIGPHTVTCSGDINHYDADSATCYIFERASISCTNPNYTGSQQSIATCSGGTISGNMQTAIGSYTVTCSGDNNHANAISTSCSLNGLPKAEITCDNKNYNGSYQTIASCSGGTISDNSYKAAGDYTITCEGDSSHENADSKTCSIYKVSATISCLNRSYNGSEQSIATCSGGTISGHRHTAAGNYTVSCTPDSNHTAPDSKICELKPSNCTWQVTGSSTDPGGSCNIDGYAQCSNTGVPNVFCCNNEKTCGSPHTYHTAECQCK